MKFNPKSEKNIAFATMGFLAVALAGPAQSSTSIKSIEGPAIHSIELHGSSKIILTQGKTQKITVEASASRLQQLDLAIKYGELKGKNHGNCSSDCEVTYRVQVTEQFKEIDHSGKLILQGTGVNLQKLELDLSGKSTVALSGEVSDFEMDSSGMVDFKGAALKTKNAEIDASGYGSITLSVSKNLKTDLSGAIDLSYEGNPNLKKMDISGLSEVSKKNQ